MNFELTILGSNSAVPLINRHPTSQFLTIADRHFLIDCGEGTQIRLRENGIGFGRIDRILISHLHGDHFFGLIPLLSTLSLLDRKKAIHIYAPKGLEQLVRDQLKVSSSWLKYPLIFYVLETKKKAVVFEDTKVIISSFPLSHSIECWGFEFKEKQRHRKIKKSFIESNKVPITEIKAIKEGADWTNADNVVFKNTDITLFAGKPFSYAYCTDTEPTDISAYIDSPDLLYHEATFLTEHLNRAIKTKHSTALQAAEQAQKLKTKFLLIGHFSIRYDNLNDFLDEAKSLFRESYLAEEKNKYVLKQRKSDYGLEFLKA